MPSPLSACNRLILFSLLSAGLLSALPLVVRAQSIAPEGSEYPIVAPLAGDQDFPRLSLSRQGGFMVWQDNGIDHKGLGVAGLQLDENCSPVGNPFQVNQNAKGDQEKPDVALFNDGRAIFAWHAEKGRTPNIFVRFRSADGSFLTGDILVGSTNSIGKTNFTRKYTWGWTYNRLLWQPYTFVKCTKVHRKGNQGPAVAVLPDGSSVVVYSGRRSTATNNTVLTSPIYWWQGRAYVHSSLQWVSKSGDFMDDVYLQRFSPSGEKLGSEIQVNQFSYFNQRNPRVAVLKNGNLLVTWVSEDEIATLPGGRIRVVIKGRLFNAAGTALGGEFRVDNTGTTPALCANPELSPTLDGGSTVIWSGRALAGTNRWDVFARHLAADGSAAGPAFRLNSFTANDQYAGSICTLGTNQFAVWTSVNQDGSREGVFGRLLRDSDVQGPEFQVNTVSRGQQLHPALASDQRDRLVVAWASFGTSATALDLRAQNFALPAMPLPPAPSVAALGSGSLQVSWPAITLDTLQEYEVYMDGATTPTAVTSANSWVAEGLVAASTHSFRYDYVLADRGRSDLSAPGTGTTPALSMGVPVVPPNPVVPSGVAVVSGSTNGTGALRITAATIKEGSVRVAWSTEPGAVYQVQLSTNLAAWANASPPRTASSTTDAVSLPPNTAVGFYRVMRVR